jgi:putative 4-mercaptohistidine N1-methyltranferase
MANLYESPRLLDEYLLFHYGSDSEILPWPAGPRDALHFPVRTVTEMTDGSPRSRALDLGCAVGRSSFELSRFCVHVTGVDFSHSFIAAAETLRTAGQLDYTSREEAHQIRPLTARRPEHAHPERICFQQGDAMNLAPEHRGYDLVHAANILCRLTAPAKLLARLPDLVAPGGTLILTTPCTWLEEFTPPGEWPRGTTFDWLAENLSPHFQFTARRDLPFLIREHSRKFQYTVALSTVWTRR